MLFPISNRRSTLEKKCFLLIYKQILRPLLTYELEQICTYSLKRTSNVSKQGLKNKNKCSVICENLKYSQRPPYSYLQDCVKNLAGTYFKSIQKSTDQSLPQHRITDSTSLSTWTPSQPTSLNKNFMLSFYNDFLATP
uniref:Uncharacterized protein n=1 Tax=Sipha flava TaxID=143950 RepID=A0A2S2Q204_9HEMI